MEGVLDTLKDYLDQKFEQVTQNSHQPVNPTAAKPVTLSSKDNQSQYDHQEKVLNLIEQAKTKIESNKEEAIELLESAKEQINKRIKLIKIADKHEGGWQTVVEYMSDELASDSDDEKKIRRANNAAMQKRKKRSVEFRSKRGKFPQRFPSSRQSFNPATAGIPPFQSRGTFRKFGSRDTCFSCGLQGHWRKNCPNGNASKSYAGGPSSYNA